MSLLIPDVKIINTYNKILDILRTDYSAHIDAGTEERSMLYLLFQGNTLGKYDLYANIKQLIITTPEDPNHLEVRLSYDPTSTTSNNMIYVTLASENAMHDSLQIGEGDNPELLFTNDDEANEYRKQFTRRFATTYTVMVMGKNRNEMLVLFHLLKAMTITCINHLTQEGLQNVKIGGQDVRFTGSDIGLFARGINISFEYEQTVPEVIIKTVVNKIRVILIADDSSL